MRKETEESGDWWWTGQEEEEVEDMVMEGTWRGIMKGKEDKVVAIESV